jgi:dolichol-phosphate mannosyltransferase
MDQKSLGSEIDFSLVIPLYNEEENLEPLVEEIQSVMNSLCVHWELLLVDDGSTDSTAKIIYSLSQKNPSIRPLFFKQNWGQSGAFLAGFEAARGTYVITMDGDRQNDPQDIPKLIQAMAGADMIVGWRVNRRDTWFKRVISKFSNATRRRICDDGVHDTGCSLKIMKRSYLRSLPSFKGMHRFLPALFVMEGCCVKELPVNHRKREKGVTKYHFFNRLSPIIDLFVMWWLKRRWVSRHKISLSTLPGYET